MSFVEQLINKEIKCNSSAFRRNNVSRSEFVDSMQHTLTLEGHSGCVNTLCWNEAGTLLASGSDDQTIIVWSEGGRKLRRIRTAHESNIFSVIFLPNSSDKFVVSGAGDRTVLLHDLEHLDNAQMPHVQKWTCENRVKRLAAIGAHPRLFWSASEDGCLRQYDTRCSTSETLVDLSSTHELKSLAVNEQHSEMIALALNDYIVPIYDRRNMNTPLHRLLPGHFSLSSEEWRRPDRSPLVTHVAFSHRGDEIIVNIGCENIYIFNVLESEFESSPNVLEALERFFASEVSSSSTLVLPHNSQIECSQPRLFGDIRKQMENYVEKNEFSKAIDFCSTALDSYFKKIRLSRLPFTKSSMDHYNLSSQNHTPSRQIDVASDLPCLFQKRGACYVQRAWEGDAMAALRDFLCAVELRPHRQRDAHFQLVETLDSSFNQRELAAQCFELYKTYYGMDDNARHFSLMLETRKERELAKSPSGLAPKPENKKWTQEKYSQFRDYTDRFVGHCNMKTDIKEANWFGGRDEMIVAGSDFGYMFLWERSTQKILRLFKADEYSLNCVQCHPSRFLIASSGIDHVIRFWEPARTALDPIPEEERHLRENDRNLTAKIYETTLSNQEAMRERPLELLMSSVGIPPAFFTAGDFDELFLRRFQSGEDEGGDSERGVNAEGAIRCRTM